MTWQSGLLDVAGPRLQSTPVDAWDGRPYGFGRIVSR